MRVLIIDNYDSFTFNLFQYTGEILEETQSPGSFALDVIRNDECTLDEIKSRGYDRIIVSPGPGHPADPAYFGVCADVITKLGPEIPLLGVCLGMQGIAQLFGGRIERAEVPMHGKTSPVHHNGRDVFRNLPDPIEIMRYHSLVVSETDFPADLEITARKATTDGTPGEIMGLIHRHLPIQGIQFHPESFATEGGKRMLENFLLPAEG
jgi:anthranilate synthase component 2